MNYKEMRNTLEQMANENHEDFAKALISLKKESMIKLPWISYTRNIWITTV